MGVLAFLFDLPVISHTRVITDTWGISFLMQAWWMFCICSVIFIITSLCTPAPSLQCVEGLTWANPLASLRDTRGQAGSLRSPLTIALLLLLTMIILYIVFR
jgi:SSS family solute:Na+ symporter